MLNIKGCTKPRSLQPDCSREGVLRDVKTAVELLPLDVKKVSSFDSNMDLGALD